MKSLFNKTPDAFIPATHAKREEIIAFIVQALKPYVDERSLSVAGLHFYILCASQEEIEVAQVALYADKPGLFRKEHLERKLINHFIQLEPDWFFESKLVKDQLPENCIQQGAFGLKVVRPNERIVTNYSKASIEVLVGQAEQSKYILDPHTKFRFEIGRSKAPKLSSGKMRLNDIVLIGQEEAGYDERLGHVNLHVSRNHAYILYEPKSDQYFIYPDKGGLPDNGNKTKVHMADDKVKWLNIYGVGHALQEGDQIELGGEVLLKFYKI